MGLLAIAAAVLGRSFAAAAPSPADQQRLEAAEGDLKEAARLYRDRQFRAAGDAVRKVQEALAASASNNEQLSGRRAKLYSRLAKAHALLELEGIKLPPLKLPEAPPPKKPAKGPSKNATASRKPSGVSFVGEVVPILVEKCGECHVTGSRGRLSMASFADLGKGGKSGPALTPGSGEGSRMIKSIKSGDMPRNGGKLSPEQLATLTKWIDEGARFDGADPAASLMNSMALVGGPERVELQVAAATGKEGALFSRDVGPALLANCMGCHSIKLTLGDLRLDPFTRLLRGGKSGVIVVPGQPDASLLIRKLKGLAGARMPMGGPPLPDATIAKIARWIADGARYDAYDPNQPLAEVVAMSKAIDANHEELARMRAEMAAKNWKLMLPDAEPVRQETEHFLLIGNVGPKLLSEVAATAEKQVPSLRRLFRVPAGPPFIKGKMTIFVFDKRYDYSEIGPMIEQREIPSEWRGHWRYTFIDAYGCVLPPSAAAEYSLNGLVAQQIAGVHIASLGRVPRWFPEGAARVAAGKLDPKDARVRAWDARLPEIVNTSGSADRFVRGALPPEDADLMSYGFVRFLMGSAGPYRNLLTSLRGGTQFEQAFTSAYGAAPNQVVAAWAAKFNARAGR